MTTGERGVKGGRKSDWNEGYLWGVSCPGGESGGGGGGWGWWDLT